MSLNFLTLLLFALTLKQTHQMADGTGNDCFKYLIGDTLKNYACGSPGLFPASSLSFPISLNPLKELTVSLTIIPTSLCSITTDFNFLTVSILPGNTGGVRRKVMILKYLAATNEIAWRTEVLSGATITVQTAPVSSFLNKPFNMFLSVSMVSGTYSIGVGGTYDNQNKVTRITTVTYHSSWVFDSTTELSVCSDSGGTNSIACTVQNLKVKYAAYTSNLSIINFSNLVTMLGDYKFNDAQLQNSQGILSSAILSSPSPTWNSNGGLTFTSPSQYIELPNFIPSASDITVITSVAFAFYIKIDTAPATTSNVMSYYCSSIPGVVFDLKITPNGQFTSRIDTVTSIETTYFVLGQWTLAYVTYSYTVGGYGASNIYLNGVRGPSATTVAGSGSSVFSNSDKVRFGEGFLGQIRRIQVYSPAAFRLNPGACDATTCALDIGFTIPATCLQAICPSTSGTYTSFGSCENCPKACTTCTDATTCQSCHSDYYHDGTSCLKCPQGQYINSPTSCANCPSRCSSCTDPQTCQSCNPGYGLINNYCVVCPSGTYLTNDQKCQEFSPVVQETLEKTQLLTSGATQASGVASRGGSISLSAAVSGRIFSQIKYLNISYSGELQVALKTWLPSFVSLGLTPDMPDGMIRKIPSHHVPYVFEKYEVSSSFLRNFWESLGIVVFVALLWMLFRGIELALDPRQRPKIASFMRKARIIVQNFSFMVLYGVYGDLVMFSIVEYRAFAFGWNLSLLSFFVSLIMLAVMFVNFWYQTKLLIEYQKLKKQDQNAPADSPKLLEKFTKKHEGSQVIFKDFKDYSIAPQLFLFFLSGRDLVCSLILATMFEYPLPQTIIITILDILMVVYLFIKKPFQSNFEFIQQLFFESTGIVVNVSVFVNAVLDAGKFEALGTRKNIGKLVIFSNMVFNFVTAVFMLIALGMALFEYYKEQKEKRSKIFRTLSTIKSRPNEIQNKSRLDSNQSFLNDSSMISPHLALRNISLQPESAGLNLLPQQILPSKRNKRLQKNPTFVNDSCHFSVSPRKLEIPENSTHLQIEPKGKYPFSQLQQRRLNKNNNDILRGSITYDPTENLSKKNSQK